MGESIVATGVVLSVWISGLCSKPKQSPLVLAWKWYSNLQWRWHYCSNFFCTIQSSCCNKCEGFGTHLMFSQFILLGFISLDIAKPHGQNLAFWLKLNIDKDIGGCILPHVGSPIGLNWIETKEMTWRFN